jgi:HSP20 family protein
MTNIIKKDNGRQPATFGSVVDQIFQDNLSRFFDDSFWGFSGVSRNQVPVNVRETDKLYEMEVMAPGLKKEDFRLEITHDMLTVSYEDKKENTQENKKEGWVKKEFSKQSFSRSFKLDDSIDANNITARYEDGVLYLALPKKENAQRASRQISVQ